MLRSRANTLVSVRRVSQHNTGRHTAGVDRQVALTSLARANLAMRLHRRRGPGHALPVRRVYIVRRAALGCIPNAVGRNLEECFWV